MQNVELASFAYHAYCVASGNVDPFGEPLTPWETLGNCCRQAWEATAGAVAVLAQGDAFVREVLTASAEGAEALGTIEKALEALPDRCQYHGTNVEGRGFPYPWTREACCDSGRPARRRLLAEQAVARLREVLAV